MKKIKLNHRFFAIVDDDLFDKLNTHKWGIQKAGDNAYAFRTENHSRIYMHRYILGVKDGTTHIDHANGDGLDNRRENLRVCHTRITNHWNKKKPKLNRVQTSKYKGVRLFEGKYWYAQIYCSGKQTHLGKFNTEKEAAKAYDAAARLRFGAFACTNFPINGERSAIG